jgi:chaperonin GroEL
MDLKRGIDVATAKVVESIKAASREVKDSDEVAQVGTISANGEAEIGRQIARGVNGSPVDPMPASISRP